jgi:hypothetical protein
MEFYKHGKKWYREGWVDFGHHFGLGISIYHHKGKIATTWSVDITLPLFNFYSTFYKFKKD